MAGLNNHLAKAAIRMIGAENIAAGARELLKEAIKRKNEIPLNPGETEIIGVIYEAENVVYFSTAAINAEDKITRQINFYPIDDFIKKYLETL